MEFYFWFIGCMKMQFPRKIGAFFLILSAFSEFLLIGMPFFVRHDCFGGLDFERIAAKQGLNQHIISEIVQDRRGFIWLATEDGLVKYDGYAFTTFRPAPLKTTNPEDATLYSLCLSRTGDLWIVGRPQVGLRRFNVLKESWQGVSLPSGMEDSNKHSLIRAVIEDQSGLLWIAIANRGLFWYDPVTHRSEQAVLHPFQKHGESMHICALYQSQNGDIWIGTWGQGLFQYTPKTGAVRHYHNVPTEPDSLSLDIVSCIVEDSHGTLWIGTRGGGVNRLIHKNDRSCFLHYPQNAKSLEGASLKDIQAVIADHSGHIWAGAFNGGVSRIDPQSDQILNFFTNPADSGSISSNQILSVYEDRSENLWIGTWGNGLCKLNQRRLAFSHLQNHPENPESLSNNEIQCVREGRNETLWLGTWGGGLNRWDRTTGKIVHFSPDSTDPQDFSRNAVISILEDSRGTLWFGTLSGKLGRLPQSSDRFHFIDYSPHKTEDSIPYVLYEDQLGDIWVGVNPQGIVKMDKNGKVLASFQFKDSVEKHPIITILAIQEADQGTLLLGTSKGLFFFETATGKLTTHDEKTTIPDDLSQKAIYCIVKKNSTGTFWIGAADGLYQYFPEANRFIYCTPLMGIPKCEILGVLEDSDNYLWLLTSDGIFHANPKGKVLHKYNVLDGLQSNILNYKTFIRTRHGEIFAGGNNGLDWFRPESARRNQEIPSIGLTGFQLFNQPVPIEEGATAILSRRVSETETIILDHRQNVLTFEFAVLDFSEPARCQYAYRMDGFDKDWIFSGSRRQAIYTNLDPGTYVFCVKGAGEEGIWNETGTSIRITIRPPFYRTGWFLTLVIIGLLAAGGISYSVGSKLLTKFAERHRMTRFGKFKLIEKIGSGGTGEVFLTKDNVTGKTGALKIIHESIISPRMQAQFLQEGLVCETILHQNITRIWERGAIHGRSYLFMEYVDGRSLQRMIDERAITSKFALAITSVLLDIIEEIHTCGVIHRDLKPENILFMRGSHPLNSFDFHDMVGQVKSDIRILDFGLARFIENQTLTRIDLDSGTPLFLPPEYFWNRHSPEPTVDFYALGIILYLMLTGETPYPIDQDDVYQTIFKIVHQEPIRPAQQNPDVPLELSDFTMAMIQKDITMRLRDYDETKFKLEALVPLL